MLRLAEKLEQIQATGVLAVDLSWLNNNYQRFLTRYARRCSADRLRNLQAEHRYAVLICFLWQVYQDTVDHMIDMHHKLMTTVYKRAQEDIDEQNRRQRQMIRSSLTTLHTLGQIILDESINDEALAITDAKGEVVYQAEPATPVRVLDERVAWLISDMLSDVDARILSFGQDSILNIGRTAAVKTGTTNDFHDNWTVGYTPDVVVGVWVGNADNTPMFNVTGVSGAGPIWHMIMRSVLSGTPDRLFVRPEGLTQVEVCRISGLLPSADCPFRQLEWFITGTEPQEADTFYEWVTLDKRSMRLATEETPAAEVIAQLALDLPPDLHPWARTSGLLLLDDLLVASAAAPIGSAVSLRLVSPDPNTRYRQTTAVPFEVQKLPVQVVGGRTKNNHRLAGRCSPRNVDPTAMPDLVGIVTWRPYHVGRRQT